MTTRAHSTVRQVPSLVQGMSIRSFDPTDLNTNAARWPSSDRKCIISTRPEPVSHRRPRPTMALTNYPAFLPLDEGNLSRKTIPLQIMRFPTTMTSHTHPFYIPIRARICRISKKCQSKKPLTFLPGSNLGHQLGASSTNPAWRGFTSLHSMSN